MLIGSLTDLFISEEWSDKLDRLDDLLLLGVSYLDDVQKSVTEGTSLHYCLPLSLIQTLSDACAADSLWKHCGKRRIAHNEWFILLPQYFQLYSKIIITFIYRNGPLCCPDAFKVVCCRFDVHGKETADMLSLDSHNLMNIWDKTYNLMKRTILTLRQSRKHFGKKEKLILTSAAVMFLLKL